MVAIRNISEVAAAKSALKEELGVQVRKSPIQYYGTTEVFVPSASLVGDIAFADDREGTTGKLWAFYYKNAVGIIRREMPSIHSKGSELGAEVTVGVFTDRINHFVYHNNTWYCGSINKVYKFTNGINANPEEISTVSVAGSNGDVNYVRNAVVDVDDAGVWHCWYATYDGTNNGMRHATAVAPEGPWTIDVGFWLTPANIDSTQTWVRIFKPFKDEFGNLWGLVGSGNKWGGTAEPTKDDGASVWIGVLVDYGTKPVSFECICQLPYFVSAPFGSDLINNAYAPSFLQDGDKYYLFVNSGVFAAEQILKLEPMRSDGWAYDSNLTAHDYVLTNVHTNPESAKITVRDGVFKVTFSGALFLKNATAEYHTVNLAINDTDEVTLMNRLLQTGANGYESRLFEMSVIVNAIGLRTIRLWAKWEVGAGQVTPTDSRIKGLSVSVEQLAEIN